MPVEYGRARKMTRLASTFLPAYTKTIAPHVVVHYDTRNPHVDAFGRLLPEGTHCLALRAPTGQLCLIFRAPGGPGTGFTAVWCHPNSGLVGIEPNVIDPRNETLENVTAACNELTAHALAWARAGCPPIAPQPKYEMEIEADVELSVDALSEAMKEVEAAHVAEIGKSLDAKAERMMTTIEKQIEDLDRDLGEKDG